MVAAAVGANPVGAWREALAPLRIPVVVTLFLLGLAQVGSIASDAVFSNTLEPLRFFAMIALAASLSLVFGGTATSRGDAQLGSVFERVGQMLGFVALAGGTTLALAVLSYLAARIGFPDQDANFVRADGVLGFHWLDWKAWVDGNPLLRWLLSLAYASYAWQIACIFVVLAVLPDRKRSLEAYCAFALAGLGADIVSGILPAIGAGPYLGGTPAVWTPALALIHAPGAMTVDMKEVEGIVSLPSFHAAIAVIVSWAVRRTWVFGWLVAAINVVMIVSTLSQGGHYLVDTLAGLALAAATITIAHRVVYRPSAAPELPKVSPAFA